MATVYGNTVNDFWRAQLDYTVTETATQIKIAVTNKCHIVKKHTHNSQHDRPNYVSCDGVQKNFYPTWGGKYSAGTVKTNGSSSFTVNKQSSARTVTLKIYQYHKRPDYGTSADGTSQKSVSITIPALTPVTISFNTNGDSVRPVSGTPPATINTYKGVATTIPTSTLTRQGYTFTGWNTAQNGTGTQHSAGSKITVYANTALYAQWETTYVKPNIDEFLAYRVVNDQGGATPTVVSVGTTGFCKLSLVGGANYTVTSVSVQFGTAAARAMTKTGAATYHCCSVVGSVSVNLLYTVKVTVVVTGNDGVGRTYVDETYISKSISAFEVFLT